MQTREVNINKFTYGTKLFENNHKNRLESDAITHTAKPNRRNNNKTRDLQRTYCTNEYRNLQPLLTRTYQQLLNTITTHHTITIHATKIKETLRNKRDCTKAHPYVKITKTSKRHRSTDHYENSEQYRKRAVFSRAIWSRDGGWSDIWRRVRAFC